MKRSTRCRDVLRAQAAVYAALDRGWHLRDISQAAGIAPLELRDLCLRRRVSSKATEAVLKLPRKPKVLT